MSKRKQSKSKTVLVRVARNKVVIGPGGVVKIRLPTKRRAKKNPCAWKRPTIWKRKKTAPNKRRKSVARTPKRRTLKAKPRRAPAKKARRRR